MIPYLLIILGIISALFGCLGLLSIAILPFYHRLQIVYKRKDDYVFYETSAAGKMRLRTETQKLIWDFLFFIIIGVACFFFGIYLGYAAKGDGFWFYKAIFGEDAREEYWDQINEDGQYVSEDGNVYAYYILVIGDQYIFNGEECADGEELRKKLTDIRRENTVALIDDFAVAARYHQVKSILKELGIKYETEEK